MKYYTGFEWFLTPHWLRRFGPLRLVSGSLIDRVNLHFFTVYTTLSGILQGVFTLSQFVMIKALDATEFHLAIINSLAPMSLLIGIYGSELSASRDKRPAILWLGMLSRGSFLLFLLVHDVWSFIVVSAIFFIFNSLLMPSVFGMWQSNVSATARNKLWGITVTLTTIFSMLGAFFAGQTLDHNPDSFRWIFAVSGLLGMFGVATLALAPLRGKYKLSRRVYRPSFVKAVVQPIKTFRKLLAEDTRFRQFESYFFCYGFALMLMSPVLPHYMTDVVEMNYKQAGLASGLLSQLGVLFLPPLWGKLMDRRGPEKLCAIVFALLALFPGVLLIAPLLEALGMSKLYIVYLSHIFMGVGMSGISVAWSLAPVSLAGKRDSSAYTGAHVTITGIRGSIAPLLGAVVLTYMGYSAVFAASTALFLIGAGGMFVLMRRYAKAHMESLGTAV